MQCRRECGFNWIGLNTILRQSQVPIRHQKVSNYTSACERMVHYYVAELFTCRVCACVCVYFVGHFRDETPSLEWTVSGPLKQKMANIVLPSGRQKVCLLSIHIESERYTQVGTDL